MREKQAMPRHVMNHRKRSHDDGMRFENGWPKNLANSLAILHEVGTGVPRRGGATHLRHVSCTLMGLIGRADKADRSIPSEAKLTLLRSSAPSDDTCDGGPS
jgi:hypothetical protein